MNSPADADAPVPAQREAEPAWGTKVALGVVAFIMIVEFVLPGFLAAGFSRVVPGFGTYGKQPAFLHTERIMLAPAIWLFNHSEYTRRLYRWEYLAGGGTDGREFAQTH